MIHALLSDLHGNREALTACLADMARRNVDQFTFLGDLVGYGADPGWVVDRVAERVARGALVVMGNHDAAACGMHETMNSNARAAIRWTRDHLDRVQRGFLAGLPLSLERDGRLFVHASAHEPDEWHYVEDEESAAWSFEATTARQIFCGHVHVPAVFCLAESGHLSGIVPRAGAAIPLESGQRWVAIIGSVGQPRDHNPMACYALLDDVRDTLTYVRVSYDVATAARKIRESGLPPFLAARLAVGR